jgi:hypothetical protein
MLGLALAASGCAEEREPINRVQPYALKKSDYVGNKLLDPSDDPEFYLHTTLTDVGYGAHGGMFTSTYTQPVARIKWVIEEDYLLGRLTYERVPGTDGKGTVKPSDGKIAVRFRILKHFDIKRAYNSTTGEELNIIDENSTDRPWYEREHFRVDWSQNLVTDSYEFDLLKLLGTFSGYTYTAHPYFINDPTHPDGPVFEMDQGYFDVTTKAFASPNTVSFPHWGIYNFPVCYMGYTDWGIGQRPDTDCSPIELTIRHSFLKVEDRDYQPAHWDGHRFQAFGAFYTERMGYDRNYGLTDSEHYRLISRFNIWERSHYYKDPENMTGAVECFVTPGTDPNEDRDGDGTADECAAVTDATGVRGSQCDTFNQKCTLPYQIRETRPNPWFFTNGSNLEFFEATRDAVIEWDAALRFAAQAAKYAECISTGSGTREKPCRTQFPVPFGQQDENQDLLNLIREVEDCRIGRAYKGEDCATVARRVGKSRGYLEGVQEIAAMDNIFALCHSPVEHGDPEICGGPRLPKNVTAEMCQQADLDRDQKMMGTCRAAKNARLGDVRYHQTNVIKEVQTNSPWGIMVDANDPLTGEKLAASANVWSHVNDFIAQSSIDMARYAKGELSTEDVTEGKYVMDWVEAAKTSKRGGILQPMTKAQIDKRLAGVVGVDVDTFHDLSLQGRQMVSHEQLAEQLTEFQHIRAEVGAPSTTRPLYDARRNAALDSYVEASLMTPMMQQLAGSAPMDASLREQLASPFRGANPVRDREMTQLREMALAARGACMINETPSPISVTGLAEVLERKFGQFNPDDDKVTQLERAERMRKFLAHRFHHAVMAHEMGHSVGLRHNFVSSSDAFGYRPQYWQLRTQNGERNRPCTDLNTPAGCVGPRYFDPITEEQSEQLIQMFMHSSVMDYPGDYIQDMVGLGIYDFAAARMMYADLTSVHTDHDYRVGQPKGDMLTRKLDNFGGILGYSHRLERRELHYSELNDVLGLIRDCKTTEPTIFKPAYWDEERLGAWDPLVDGHIVKVGGEYSRCKQQDVDYIPWTNLKLSDNEGIRERTGPVHDSLNRVRVPYGFATDHWADTGNVAVFRHDNGADPYELFDFLITQQEMSHIFDNYRRNRLTFSVRGAAFRTLSRYNEKMRDAAKGLGLISNIYREFAKDNGFDYHSLWAYQTGDPLRGNAVASTLAFDHFTRQLQRPQPGVHMRNLADSSGFERLLRSEEDSYTTSDRWIPHVTVPNGASGRYGNVTFGGKPMENALANNKGDYSSRYTVNSGAYYDKVFTPYLMTESYDNFISSTRSDFLDTRYRAVSMADLFPEGYRRWLATNLTGDEFLKGTRITVPNDPKDAPPSGLGWTSWTNFEGPETCFVGEKNLNCVTGLDPDDPDVWVLESQVGWEQQKFLIAYTLLFLPENAKQHWINQLRVWEIGLDTDPEIPSNARIEFHDPEGRKYVARTFGKEILFGKEVQKGIAARVLEYANELLEKAYETTPVDIDGDGVAEWYKPVYDSYGMPKVKYDPGTIYFNEAGGGDTSLAPADCSATDNSGCTCEANRFCVELRGYSELPFYLREVMGTYRHGYPYMK